ncbi:hypothetical protein HY086_03875 [Candidatus Gottesmanbacteria bacterium]|nr:hypothetical protein [Candidatus Gottesmanbacteria bacterium]
MKRILQLVGIAQQYILLHAMYFVGIGIPAAVAKFFGKHFLPFSSKNTSWIKHKQSSSHNSMY